VLGLTGPNAAGKGEVARLLKAHGFRLHSLSDIIREEAESRGLPPEREHLIRIGNDLRASGGAGVLAQAILPRLDARDVVDSIRNPAEVEVLRSLPEFLLIGVRAAVEIRFRRCVDRQRPGDPATLKEFSQREAEENTDDVARQQLNATFALADRIVENDGDLEQLQRSVLALLDHG